MEESSNSIVESRQHLMISPTTHGNPTLRTAHFLKPSIDSNFQAISNLSPLPLPSFPPKLNPANSPLTVKFNGWKNPPKNWNEWVHRMASLHAPIWKRSGIYEAIFSSTYRFNKHDDVLLAVAEKWCPDTKSFIFPWGEATVTLEDMLVAGYSVSGSPVFKPLETDESMAVQEALVLERREIINTPAKKPYHNAWLKVFMDSGSEIEHEAFLSLWLSRFVLPTSNDVICECVFPVAIHLARGTRIALAPAVLSTIYRDLTLLKQKIVSLTTLDAENDQKLVATTYAPFQLVLIWVWERFVNLSPKPNLLKIGEPTFAQWNKLTCNPENVRLVLDSSNESFNWRPYTKFYKEKEMQISPDSGVDEEMLSLIMCLRVSELVGLETECIEQYLPQRVARQFGFDQDIPGFVAQCNATRENAWDSYIRPVTGMECYIPSRLFEGDVTTRYLEWWNHSVSVQHQEKTSEITPEVPKEKEKGQESFSSSQISLKSLKRKRAAGELNVSKVSAESSKRSKKGESSIISIGKKAAAELNGLKVSAQSSEKMKKGEPSNSPTRKKATGELKGLKVSAKSMKKGGTSKRPTMKSVESSRIKNKVMNKPAISLVVDIGELLVRPGSSPKNATVKAGDPTADDNITIAEMIKCMKTHSATASNKQCASSKKSGDKLDSHLSPVAANEFAKTSDSALSGMREGQIEAIENEKEGDSKPACSPTQSYSCSAADNESPARKKSADKLDGHLSQVAANEFAKNSDIALSEVREGQSEAIENEKEGDSKPASSPTQSYSCSAADNESPASKKSADKLDSHLSQVSANEFAKTSDIALSGVREGQSEAIENEKDGVSKPASSPTRSYSSSAADNESPGSKKSADKLDSHLSPVAAIEFAKTSDSALSGVRKGQSEAVENEKEGDSKPASSPPRSYSSSAADNESLSHLKQSEACESKQTHSNGNVSDTSHQSQSHLSANGRSPNVLDPVASTEMVKYSKAGGSQDDTWNKAAAQIGGFHSHAESESLNVYEPAPLVEMEMLSEATEFVENVDHVHSTSTEKAEVSKEADESQDIDMEVSKEAEESQDIDMEDAPRQLDQSESHSSSVAGNEADNGNEGSNKYSIDTAEVMMLEKRIEKLEKIMAERKAALIRKIMANRVSFDDV